MVGSAVEPNLEEEIRKVQKTIDLLNVLLDVGPTNVVFYGPSRHLVARSPRGNFIAKSYKDPSRYETEQRNLETFDRINQTRSPVFQEVSGLSQDYLGLPKPTNLLDMGGLEPNEQNGARIRIFTPAQGDLLYDKTLQARATFEDYVGAAVQIARIQQEGTFLKRRLNLRDVVEQKEYDAPDTAYFQNRFKGLFLGQLSGYGHVPLSERLVHDMMLDWEVLVAQNLVRMQKIGYAAFYFDGNPTNHVITPDGRIVSFDLEDSIMAPLALGVASLVSFGMTKGMQPYLSEKDEARILDRFLLEREFARALKEDARDKARRIVQYTLEMSSAYDANLSGQNGDEFFRFLGDGDKGHGIEYREGFLEAWPYAMLDRNAAWIGHKARFRSLAERLAGQVKFTTDDPVRQNAIEQRSHMDRIIQILGIIKEAPIRNGRYANDAADRLQDRFLELASNPYFSP